MAEIVKKTRKSNPARGSKPGEKRGGRGKGTPNKVTASVKQAIEAAAEGLGGVDRLIAWAKEEPANERIFWGNIYPKLLPLQIANDPTNPFTVQIIRFADAAKQD